MEDTLAARIGLLTRREVEVRLLAPVLAALGEKFGRERVRTVVGEAIATLAREQGAALAARLGGNTLADFAPTTGEWAKDDALEFEVVARTADTLAFNVTRCRYAEMYRALGVPELGEVLSCARDFAFIEGFNPNITLQRTQTILGGAPCCDFVYRMAPER